MFQKRFNLLTKKNAYKRLRIVNNYRGGKRFKTFSYQETSSNFSTMTVAALLTGVAAIYYSQDDEFKALAETKQKVDYDAVRRDLSKLLANEIYDDGSYGPVLVRLAWHAAGSYSMHDGSGGASGAGMRWGPESDYGANKGLHIARELLEPIKKKYPGISYSDLWTLAGCVAIEEMGGPKITWRPGRSDFEKPKTAPDGRLPDASKGADHVREVFYRMGFNDQEIVALIGCHVLGRAHKDRSGYHGPWTNSPTTFSNDFFVQLKERKWKKKKWEGPEQFEDESGTLMMLPADMVFLSDPKFRKYVDLYAEDEEKFFADFAKAFQKLMELGVKF